LLYPPGMSRIAAVAVVLAFASLAHARRELSPNAGRTEREVGAGLLIVSGSAAVLSGLSFGLGFGLDSCHGDGPCPGAVIGGILGGVFLGLSILSLVPAIPVYVVGAVKGHRARRALAVSVSPVSLTVKF
jgi:hypothetical protein